MSSLDLTLASPVLARTGECHVLRKDSMGSDHFPVLGRLGRSLIIGSGDRMQRFNFARAEWGQV